MSLIPVFDFDLFLAQNDMPGRGWCQLKTASGFVVIENGKNARIVAQALACGL
jgi:hypothetical protein